MDLEVAGPRRAGRGRDVLLRGGARTVRGTGAVVPPRRSVLLVSVALAAALVPAFAVAFAVFVAVLRVCGW